jgi:hypothetical protein
VVVRSKALICSPLIPGIEASNLAEYTEVRVLFVVCCVR